MYSRVPGYQTWLFWSYSGKYPGTKRVVLVILRVDTRVPNWLFLSYSRRYPGTKFGCSGHTRGGTGVLDLVVLVIRRVHTRGPNLVVLAMLGKVPGYQTRLFWSCFGYIPGYQTWLFWSFSGRHLGTNLVCFGHTRVGIQVPKLVVLAIPG